MKSVHTEIKESPESEDSKKNIEVWEDLVRVKDLVIALIVCSVTTLGGYFLAPKDPPKPLFFGLSGAIIGFVICTIFIKPKRIFIERNQED
jgi:hypothetical protein